MNWQKEVIGLRHIHGGDLSNYDIYSSDEIIDFSANINPLGMPDAVREAARMGVDAANRYPQPYARSFCEKIAVYENAKLKQTLEKEASEERQRFLGEPLYERERIWMSKHDLLETPFGFCPMAADGGFHVRLLRHACTAACCTHFT